MASPLRMTPHAEGTVLPVRAQPNAKRNGVLGERNGALRVGVSAPPDKGRANAALVDVLSDTLKIARSAVALISGETARDKRFLVRGLTPDEVAARLAPLLPPTLFGAGEDDG